MHFKGFMCPKKIPLVPPLDCGTNLFRLKKTQKYGISRVHVNGRSYLHIKCLLDPLNALLRDIWGLKIHMAPVDFGTSHEKIIF